MLNPSVAHCWVYKYMLETEYGVRVSAMYLAQVHPCLPRARLIEVPCMRDELELIVEDQVARGEAIGAALPAAFFSLPACKIRSTDSLVCVRVRFLCLALSFYLFIVALGEFAVLARDGKRECNRHRSSLAVCRLEASDRALVVRRRIPVQCGAAILEGWDRGRRLAEQCRPRRPPSVGASATSGRPARENAPPPRKPRPRPRRRSGLAKARTRKPRGCSLRAVR